ncbi:MAG: TIGR04211 family SH3 domain-containing protein [Deltaproteobacteria bacterium]|nr:TIGR04211 family SH3 domain-containing protein [Deltaproteobacteria bacterium]MBW2117182.1 TIGR04211 family SH3 domain-containing protein [Deltaproteobacteria bacterium]MBW2343667.1 TIGR04211 family SH3 domain-containing protein [Deltaproteobacteria bacterium]
MKEFRLVFLVIFGFFLMGQTSWATKAYVTDSLEITFRTGPSIENKIITFLRSGQPLEIMESQEDWSRVRLIGSDQGHMEGWVLSRYLSTQQPWEIKARSLKQENARLKEKLNRIEQQWQKAAQGEQGVSAELKGNIEALQKVQNEYETLKREAADFLELKTVHDATRRTLETTQKTVQTLSKENENMRSSQKNKWFATGALVLLCGLMIGLLMGRQYKKRKTYY